MNVDALLSRLALMALAIERVPDVVFALRIADGGDACRVVTNHQAQAGRSRGHLQVGTEGKDI